MHTIVWERNTNTKTSINGDQLLCHLVEYLEKGNSKLSHLRNSNSTLKTLEKIQRLGFFDIHPVRFMNS